ncbi:hypothetical protein [Paenibacillus sp. R14(2021)]|uniref:hypothetical protein n=1 Tax=Paenibacillus sp. R14(2021) TaxID=2859228 RepID=UPI001C612FD9|nr:hypothetical protein [Paenibacillus sp. R14(2021)]
MKCTFVLSAHSFAPELMAMFVRSVIDTVSGRMAMNQLDNYEVVIQETIDSFMLATRREET